MNWQLHPTVVKAKKFAKRTRRDVGNTLAYLKLTVKGNKVERRTDFDRCEHPVLLLYGYGGTRSVFSVLEERLRKDGFGVFSFNLGGMFKTFNTRCIEEMAELVHEKIERLCKRHHLKKISIIGHSKGGLIGRYYIKRLGGDKRVRSLITLGTPHGGNPWALVGLFTPLGLMSKSLWQMYPMSPFIRKLQKGTWPKNVRLVSIFSKDDRICFYKSSMLDIAAGASHMKNIHIPGLTHSDYILRKSVYHVIRRELIKGEKAKENFKNV